jgi:hypothetical protein
MKRKTVLAIIALLSLLPCLAACRQVAAYDASTPFAALHTARNAKRDKDRETFKRILSSQTLEFLQQEATRTKQSVDQLLDTYLERQDSESIPKAPDHEERTGDDRTTLLDKHNYILGQFIKEGDEWKLDGFGWPMKTAHS